MNKLYFFTAVLLQGIAFAQAPNIGYTTPQTFIAGTAITPITPANTGGAITYKTISIYAGSLTSGATDGTGAAASFNSPLGVALDAMGNIYVADTKNNKIRKITPARVVTTFAGSSAIGSADGTGSAASFSHPTKVAVDVSNNVYVADFNNNKIRKITPSGEVSTFAGSGTKASIDGTGITASFSNPYGVAVDAASNVYVTDYGSNQIRKITPAGAVSTIASSGFNAPAGIAVDAAGTIYLTDEFSNNIKKITPSGVVTTLAGAGTSGYHDDMGTAARFYNPLGITVDVAGNVYVADSWNYAIRKITPAGLVTTLAKSNNDSFYHPAEVTIDPSGNLYIADDQNNEIKVIDIAGGYSITPQLPIGLSIDQSTGIISGTPWEDSPQTTYTVTATNRNGTSTTTVDITVNAVLSIDNVLLKKMVVYPNPTKGEVNIGNALVEKVNVYNNAGQLVQTVTTPEASNTTTVQLNNLPAGIYYMNIEAENGCAVRKVIVRP